MLVLQVKNNKSMLFAAFFYKDGICLFVEFPMSTLEYLSYKYSLHKTIKDSFWYQICLDFLKELSSIAPFRL